MYKLLLDGIGINLGFVLAYLLRFKLLSFINPEIIPIFSHYSRTLFFITLVWLAVFKLTGLYDKKENSLLDELAALFLSVTIASLSLLGILFLYREYWFSRLVIFNAWWITFMVLSLLRSLLFYGQGFLHKQGWRVKRVLILGADEMGRTLALKIKNEPALGYVVAGFMDDHAPLEDRADYPLLGKLAIEEIKKIIQQKNIHEVFIAGSGITPDKILDIITECERLRVEFKIVPGILELIATRLDIDEIAGIPLLSVSEIQLRGLNYFVKRTTDIVLSFFGILVLLPLFLFFALLVKISSPGAVFFRQERIGMDGKRFLIYKFRSMVENAEDLLPRLKHLSETGDALFKIKADPRLTHVGKFMRRYSIDELPQLFNVFLGQMSLVGPRPPLPREVEKYNAWHKKRLRVRPGITGPWQVAGRSLLPFEDMVRLDLYYIENWSLWLDFKILLRTFPVVLFGTGAY